MEPFSICSSINFAICSSVRAVSTTNTLTCKPSSRALVNRVFGRHRGVWMDRILFQRHRLLYLSLPRVIGHDRRVVSRAVRS